MKYLARLLMQHESNATYLPRRLPDLPFELDVDAVLRAQGAHPAKIRARQSAAVAIAERALAEGSACILSGVIFRCVAVHSVQHESVLLDSGGALTGPLVTKHLASAEQLLFVVLTLGEGIDVVVRSALKVDPPFALALDGFGTAAIGALVAATRWRLAAMFALDGLRCSVPVSPGMAGWNLRAGQREIFALLDQALGVRLDPSAGMSPQKSLSMVLGLGENVSEVCSACDVCGVQRVCRFREPRLFPVEFAAG